MCTLRYIFFNTLFMFHDHRDRPFDDDGDVFGIGVRVTVKRKHAQEMAPGTQTTTKQLNRGPVGKTRYCTRYWTAFCVLLACLLPGGLCTVL